MWMEGIYKLEALPNIMWAKITINFFLRKNSHSKNVGCFYSLELHVLGGGPMNCPMCMGCKNSHAGAYGLPHKGYEHTS